MKAVYKYATGQEIPEGAIYLSTQVETEAEEYPPDAMENGHKITMTRNFLVWHYFLVEIPDAQSKSNNEEPSK